MGCGRMVLHIWQITTSGTSGDAAAAHIDYLKYDKFPCGGGVFRFKFRIVHHICQSLHAYEALLCYVTRTVLDTPPWKHRNLDATRAVEFDRVARAWLFMRFGVEYPWYT